jgi:hypothetical protein
MKSRLGKFLVAIVTLAMMVSLVSVQVVHAETPPVVVTATASYRILDADGAVVSEGNAHEDEEGNVFSGWIEGPEWFRIEVFNMHGVGTVAGDVDVEEGETLEVTFSVTGFPTGEYTAYLGTSADWGFKKDSSFSVEFTGDGTYTIEASWDDDVSAGDVFVIDIDFENPNPEEEVTSGEPAATSGKAWIAGFFRDGHDNTDHEFSWVQFNGEDAAQPNSTVSFTVGTPFRVTLDFGDKKNAHGFADWPQGASGNLLVNTDIASDTSNYIVFVNAIFVDGKKVTLNPDMPNPELFKENTMRVMITNSWASNDGADALVRFPSEIGEFSKMEVELAIMTAGASAPDFTALEATRGGETGSDDEEEENDGIAIWVWVAIGGGVVLLIIVIVIVAKKK